MNRLFLIGPRACGKTTLGHELARALGAGFWDTDEVLEGRLGRSIADFVAEHGWDAFREEEHGALVHVIASTAGEGTAIVATGGGMVLLEKNRALMREAGTCLYLCAPVDELVRRLTRNPNLEQRPSLTGRDIREEVACVVQARDPLYRETAHLCLDSTAFSPTSCENILKILEDRGMHFSPAKTGK